MNVLSIILLLPHAFTISKYADYINIILFHAFIRFYINFLNHVKITLNKHMLLRHGKQQGKQAKEEKEGKTSWIRTLLKL